MQTPGTSAAKVNLAELVDNSRLGPVQWGVFTLCLLTLIMDGFDVQALGYIAPAIVREWGVAPSALGPVFAAGNFGVLIGSLLFSMVADRVGRRPVLVGGDVLLLGHHDPDHVGDLRAGAADISFHRRRRPRVDHPAGHLARRRIQPQGQARDADHGHHGRLHCRRGTRRLRRRRTHPGLRLALGLLLRRHRPVLHRGGHAVQAPRVAAVHGAARTARATREVAEAHRPVCPGQRQHGVRPAGGEARRRADRAPVPRRARRRRRSCSGS